MPTLAADPWNCGPNPWRADMTLGEAIELLNTPYACACIGPPWGSPRGTPCSCRLSVGQAKALQRAAHIVARLLADAAETSTGQEEQ